MQFLTVFGCVIFFVNIQSSFLTKPLEYLLHTALLACQTLVTFKD